MDWYNGAHSTKGAKLFLEQMGDVVKWLQTAEEEEEAPAPAATSTAPAPAEPVAAQ